ncbi:MAG: LamB/YcsF family protein [Verrucomicrobiae bacterium]|nr:LamB/YcsF family protein [Verrucomicrobiae bacterium]
MKIDINCDLGEGEAPTRVRALMKWVTSANVACGGHAGSLHSMDYCVRMARGYGVRLGAHPGFADRANFGRRHHDIHPADLELLLVQQVSALEKVARDGNMKLHHIKLHGALYHAVESDSGLATCYTDTVARFWPKVVIYATPEGRVAQMARFAGVTVWEEAFADRAYMSDGTLVPRSVAGAVLGNSKEIVLRMRELLDGGGVETLSGGRLQLNPKTICVHSDTAEAVRIVRALATELG